MLFQQQVEDLPFEDPNIRKLRDKEAKSKSVREHYHFLSGLAEAGLHSERDRILMSTHHRYILSKRFWADEISRRLKPDAITEESMEIAFLSLDDGFHEEEGELLYAFLSEELERIKNKTGRLRENYVVAKIEKLISIFKRCRNFYPAIRNHYKALNNQRKIRDAYIRQIRQAYDNLDVVYDQYCLWQPQLELIQKSKQIYEQAKKSWQNWMQRGQLQFFELNNVHRPNFNVTLDLKLINQMETDIEKLRYLRILCLEKHEAIEQYFELLELVYREDEARVLKNYQDLLEILPGLQQMYIRFLVRRINKHIFSSPDPDYNQTWSEKVTFFRKQISAAIEKPRLTPRIQQSVQEKLYAYWADIETALIKDKESVCQVYEALLQVKYTIAYFIKYSQSMVRLGYLADAKQVLKRCLEAFKYEFEAHFEYKQFISIYGTIKDAIQFRNFKAGLKEDEMKDEKEQTKATVAKQPAKQQPPANQKKEQANDRKNRRNDKQDIKKQSFKEASSVTGSEATLPPQQPKPEQPPRRMYTDSGNTLYLSNIPETWKEEDVLNIIKQAQDVKQVRFKVKNGVQLNYCYVQMNSEEAAYKQVSENQHKELYKIAISRPPGAVKQDRTLFLAGLPQTTTAEKIKQLFKDESDEIVDVRIKVNYNKNIAYVDFTSPEIRDAVFKKYSIQNLAIDDKKILIRCSESKPLAKKQFKVVILKKLAFKARERDVVEFFKDLNVEDVFIPENSEGKSKGFAFVKFKTQRDFEEAIKIKKGVIKGRSFEIQKSERDIQRPKASQNAQKPEQKITNSYFSDLFK